MSDKDPFDGGDFEVDFRVKNEDSVRLEEVSVRTCRCDLSKKYHCPSCDHIENCEFRSLCSQRWFHFPGEPLSDAPKELEVPQDLVLSGGLPARHKTYWTRLEDEQLVRLFKVGWDFPDIASEHQRTVGSITKRLLMLCFELNGIRIMHDPIEAGKANQPWTEDDDELVTILQLNDSSLALVSAALKRSQRAVALRLIYLRLVTTCDLDKVSYFPDAASGDSSKQSKRWTTAQYIEVREAFLQGANLSRLAEISGRSMASCLMVLHSRGEISELDLEKAVGSAQAEILREVANYAVMQGQDSAGLSPATN